MEFKFKNFSSKAVKPFLATEGSGCYDLCYADEYLIYPNSVQVINTDIGIAIPQGFIGKIFTRSNWALTFTSVEGGVIDSDYRSKIKVICHKKSPNFHTIPTGQSISHICFFKTEIVKFTKGKDFQDIISRGEKGFGSTDLNDE